MKALFAKLYLTTLGTAIALFFLANLRELGPALLVILVVAVSIFLALVFEALRD